jgi:putative transposase
MTKDLSLDPKDRAETVALFRSEIIGALTRRDLDRGELSQHLRELSEQRFRPPDSAVTRTYSIPTLQRWYYGYKTGGLDALKPHPRSDRGRGKHITDEQRQLLCDIRKQNPAASVPVILRTLVAEGLLAGDAVSASTVRRLFVDEGLDRRALGDGHGRRTRLRWQADAPGLVWQGDVCHGPALPPLVPKGASRPLRIHALIDDASRYIVAIEAHHTEMEVDMLGVLVRALRRHGIPRTLYLDNGATYRGHILRLACERLGIALLHPSPGDAPARGKIERWWRTLREGCLDFISGHVNSLTDVNARLLAFVQQHYHRVPHASLLGRSPEVAFADRSNAPCKDPPEERLTEERLRHALTVRERRRVRKDTTVSVGGRDWELDQGFLAGRVVTIARSFVDPTEAPWLEHEGKSFPLHPVDPTKNARRRRPERRLSPDGQLGDLALDAPLLDAPFDPAGALLRNPTSSDGEATP